MCEKLPHVFKTNKGAAKAALAFIVLKRERLPQRTRLDNLA